MSSIDKILEEKRRAAAQAVPAAEEPQEEDRFFSILRAEGIAEEFLEFRLRNGDITCFPYSDVNWFHWDSQNGSIDIDFGAALVTLKGRGLVPKLFNGIKTKRVAWIKEADSDMQDHKDNENFISEILILPATAEDEGGEGAAEQ
jgi:hypothetical protein